MIRRIARVAGLAVLLAASAAACGRSNAANTTDPAWVFKNTPPAKVALVFVHGIFGDTIDTWKHADGKTMFDLVHEDPKIGPKVDMLAFGYTSNMLRSGSLDIQEAANLLDAHMRDKGVLDYPAIVFVTHSMGGLVVLRELLTQRAVLPKVKALVFFGTPQEGAQISQIAKVVANNPALEQMLPADRNGYLRLLNDEWRSLPVRPPVRCAYEKRPTYGELIVPWESATRFCDGAPVPIDADHLQIVKPDRRSHGAMVTLANALDEFVLNEALTATLDLPDFVANGDTRVFTLRDPFGRESARLVNGGGTALRYTVAEVDPDLFVWPDDTPKELPARTTGRLQFALGLGATATEYRFTLTSDVTAPLPVVVRVPDLPAVTAARTTLATEVSTAVTQLLERDGARLRAVPAGNPEALEAVTRTAHDVVARRSPELPDSAVWVLTADLMDAGNWQGLAIRALRKAEAASPATARSPGVQRLAGLVGARAGENQVFTSAPTPRVTVGAPERPQPFVEPGAAEAAAVLSTAMRAVPTLRAQGLSLEGDLHRARGNFSSAERSFTEVAAIRATPSVKLRLDRVRRPSREQRPGR